VLNGHGDHVDGRGRAGQTLSYKGMMYEGVPNLASAFGYTNASWTLKCDLTCEYVCRVLNHMKKTGLRQATPRNDDPTSEPEPWLDFSSATCSGRWTSSPSRGQGARGSCTRTTPAT
jgi:cation diffusion facilitator CzcD-associated flavoprotein CzcO